MSNYLLKYTLLSHLLVSPCFSVGGESYVLWLSLPSPPQASSEGIAVVLCVCVCECVCVPSFSVLTAATLSPHIERLQTFSAVCKKLSPIDRHLSPSLKRQKPVVCQKVRFKMQCSYSPSARVFEGIK